MPRTHRQQETQAIRFDRDQWTTRDARRWMTTHGVTPMKKVDKSAHQLRYRIQDPSQFSRMRTVTLGEGVSLIVGWI